MPFVLSTFTLGPFPSTGFFYLPYLSITLFNEFPHKTRSSVYSNSINSIMVMWSNNTGKNFNSWMPFQTLINNQVNKVHSCFNHLYFWCSLCIYIYDFATAFYLVSIILFENFIIHFRLKSVFDMLQYFIIGWLF